MSKPDGWDAIVNDAEWSIKVLMWMLAAGPVPIVLWLILALGGVVGGAEMGWFILASVVAHLVCIILLIAGSPANYRADAVLASHGKQFDKEDDSDHA